MFSIHMEKERSRDRRRYRETDRHRDTEKEGGGRMRERQTESSRMHQQALCCNDYQHRTAQNHQVGPSVRDSPCSLVRSPTNRPSYRTITYLQRTQADSLVVISVSMSLYEPRLVDSVGSLVVMETALVPTIHFPLQDFPGSN